MPCAIECPPPAPGPLVQGALDLSAVMSGTERAISSLTLLLPHGDTGFTRGVLYAKRTSFSVYFRVSRHTQIKNVNTVHYYVSKPLLTTEWFGGADVFITKARFDKVFSVSNHWTVTTRGFATLTIKL